MGMMVFEKLAERCRLLAALAVVLVMSFAVGCGEPNKATTQPASQPSVARGGQGARSTTPELAPVQEDWEPGTPPGRIHAVERGETLYSIAAKYYGDSRQWRRIMTANRNRVKNERDLPVGMKLIIP